MSDTVSLPPSYQEPSSSGPSANAHQELLVQGADEPGTVTFSDHASSRTPSYRLVRNEDGGVDLVDVVRAETIYTIRAGPSSKVFTATSADSADPTPAATSVKPEKISRAGGFIYKASFPNPHLEGTRCVWKGSIFQSLELYAKDNAGQRTPIAHYIRKPSGDHFLRLYPSAPHPSTNHSSSTSSSAQSLPPFPSLPLILSTLYPFLQLYWKYTRKTFTSDKKLSEWSASAQPSRWDARILGKAPSAGAKGKEKSSSAAAGARGVHPSILPRNGNGNEEAGGAAHDDDADAKTLLSSSDEEGGGYDSDDDLKSGAAGGGKSNGAEREETPSAAGPAEEGNKQDESPSGGRAGKSPSRLGKLFGRRGAE